MLRNQGKTQIVTARPSFQAARPVRNPAIAARAVGSFVPRLTKPAFEKYGFSAATLITDWAAIVGADLARHTSPERLRWPKAPAVYAETDSQDTGRPGATLILAVDPGRALDIQYKGRQILDRINAYFGYRAVAEIRIVQAPLTAKPNAERRRNITATPAAIPAEVLTVKEAGLRAALERMAQGLAERARR